MSDTHIKINAVTPRVQYTGNGVTTTFPYEFAIFDETDMVVYVGDDIIESGYTVTGAGETEGGTVVFDTAPDDGAKITLLRDVPIERVTDFQEGGTFRPKNLNDEFDRQTAFVQQVQEKLDRTLILPPTTEIDPSQVLAEVDRIYDSIDNVDTVADNETNVNAVATNISDVSTCATNMAAILDAPTQATNAANSAIAADTSATAAAISAAGTHFKLFHHDWFDYELNDMAWLRADTFSWQDGTVYSDAYSHLVDDFNNAGDWQLDTIAGYVIGFKLASDGHKIVDNSGATLTALENIYNATGVAWYYVLDTKNQRFKLPRTKFGFTGIRSAVGNYVEAGLPNIVGSYYQGNYAAGGFAGIGSTGTTTGAFYDAKNAGTGGKYSYVGGDTTSGLGFDASRSSSIYGNSTTVQPPATQMYLYFYVGQFSQSATEQTAGLNSELFNGKADVDLSNAAPNASSSAKETIVGWGMPDYSAGIAKTVGTSYTAEQNGFIKVDIINSSYGSIVIDGVTVVGTLTNNAGACALSFVFPIAKGQVYNASGVFSITFYPAKGG